MFEIAISDIMAHKNTSNGVLMYDGSRNLLNAHKPGRCRKLKYASSLVFGTFLFDASRNAVALCRLLIQHGS
jgi:hypothetical protein